MTSDFRRALLETFHEDFGPARWYRPADALRFELAVGETRERMLAVAIERCTELLIAVAATHEIWLELTFWPDEPVDPIRTLDYLASVGGPSADAWGFERFSYEDDGPVNEARYSARTSVLPHFARALSEIVVMGDFGAHGGHFFRLYAFDVDRGLLLHPYDSRGADLYAGSAEAVRPYYERFNAWLLDFDRETAVGWMAGG